MLDIVSSLLNLVIFANLGSLFCLLRDWQGGTDTKDRGFHTAWGWSLCGGIHEGVRAEVRGGNKVRTGGPRLPKLK